MPIGVKRGVDFYTPLGHWAGKGTTTAASSKQWHWPYAMPEPGKLTNYKEHLQITSPPQHAATLATLSGADRRPTTHSVPYRRCITEDLAWLGTTAAMILTPGG